MLATTAPTSQKAGVRPISFVLNDSGSFSSQVDLVIRPEDLTRNEPTRVSVHQTLGREISGWADFFGEGLPSVTIAGHTGWRKTQSGGDGMEAFENLNNLVQHKFPAAKQAAIERGSDPGSVKLLFVDTLDNFTWSVTPTQFVLRRSRSRPLLFQYNITLQAISTSAEYSSPLGPFLGSLGGGLGALGDAISRIEGFANNIVGWVNNAVSFVQSGISYVGGIVSKFVGMANRVFGAAMSVVSSIRNGASSLANGVIGIAKDIASVGTNLFRTISAIADLPAALKAELGRVASAFNEVVCIFSGSLRPRKYYEDYEGLYGASNCSSTTGGNPASSYTNVNAFSLMQPSGIPIKTTSTAQSSINAMKATDPVLAPMPIIEMSRHIENINENTSVAVPE